MHKILVTTVRDLKHEASCGTSVHATVIEFDKQADAAAAVAKINGNPKNDVNYYQTALALN